MSKKGYDFNPDDFVVYPAHGVGKIASIEEQEIAGTKMELFVVAFEKDKMTLKVPTAKAVEVGMRASPTVQCEHARRRRTVTTSEEGAGSEDRECHRSPRLDVVPADVTGTPSSRGLR